MATQLQSDAMRVLFPHRLWLVLMFLGVLGSANAQQVWRCTDAGGKVSFQQAPCAGPGVAAAAVDATPRNIVDGAPAGDAQARVSARRNLELSDALARGQVLPGMSLQQVRQMLGEPARISRSVDGSGVASQRLVYRYADGVRTVYADDDVITQVDWVDAPAGRRQVAQAACPSAQEIRNMETSASSITAPAEQRKEWQRRIDEARACKTRN